MAQGKGIVSTQLFEVSLLEKIACLKREIGYRERVYAGLVARNLMSPEHSARELEIMRAILRDYEELYQGVR